VSRRSPAVSGLLCVLVVALGAPTASAADGPATPVIVLLRDDADVDAALKRANRNEGIQPSNTFRHAIPGYAAKLTPGQARRLATDPDVDAIVADSVVKLTGQTTPTNISRVGATLSPAAAIDGRDTRIDADVAVIDTGIQFNHPDLQVAGGYNCTSSSRGSWSDGHGHGTHVAGIVGALDNGYGVVGVAPGVRLWSVRVFDSNAYSRISWIVCGIDWITSRRDPSDASRPLIEVANMSLRDEGRDDGNCGYTTPDAEHRAICRSSQAGTTHVVAAGNDRRAASLWRPASYDEVITVSALADFNGKAGGGAAATCTAFGVRDVDDTFADFSNYGNDVDLIAPGVCIRSTYKGSTYGTSSGTSMATPAVAGAAAIYRSLHPDATPPEVRLALRAAGSDGWNHSTDRDSAHEPLLDASSLGRPPGFTLRSSVPGLRAWAGYGTVSASISVVRGNGFDGDIALSVGGLPNGVTATFVSPTLADWATGPSRLDVRVAASVAAGRYPLSIIGKSGGTDGRAVLTLDVVVDGTPPQATAPRISIVAPSTLDATSVLLRATWTGSDAGTGITRYDVEEARDGGAWVAAALGQPTQVSRTMAGRLGGTIRERVRAWDHVGNGGAWATSATCAIETYTEWSPEVSYSGTWATFATTAAWGGKLRYSKTKGSAATIRFSGRGIGWVSTKSPNRGKANVYLDGTFLATVDLWSSTSKYRQVVFAREVADGNHTLKIVVVGTSGRPEVNIDGFVALD
jgi:subtilisin family serine protease